MIKKVIGLYCGNVNGPNEAYWDSDVLKDKGLGGSETWAIEIASVFKKMGYHVIVFGNPQYWHFDFEGVEYVPYTMFEHRCEYQYFDLLIVSRRSDVLSNDINCNNIYLMSHEIGIFNEYWGNFATYEELHMDKVKKIGVLSEWHKRATMELYPELKEEQLFITCNGINQKLYEDINNQNKRNMMVWSTCLNRGLTFFGKRVLPKIIARIPDFELNICSYNTGIHGEIPEGPNVHFLGTLNKKELSDLQKQAKIWILPNYGYNDFGQPLHESFCMTAVENALSKNAIICFNKDGVATTLKDCDGIINIDWFDDKKEIHSDAEYEILASLLSDKAIELLNNNYKCINKGNEACDIAKKYTWENAAKTWLQW